MTASANPSVVFIDSRVPDIQTIMAAAAPGAHIVVLDPNWDGIQQMAETLSGMRDVASVSVVSHGNAGSLLLGSGSLSSSNLASHQAALQTIGQALGPQGDLLLYGCDIGEGAQGAQFLAALAKLTGTNVAASTNPTGGTSQGGDWNLEIATGTIDAAPALNTTALTSYDHLLITTSVNTVAGLKAAIATGSSDGSADTITLTGNLTFASAADAITINVTDSQTMTIVGGGFTLDGGYLARVLNIAAGSIELDNLTITHGVVSGAGANSGVAIAGGNALGGGISNAGNLTLKNVTVTANAATGGGGGGGVTGATVGGGGGGGSGAGGVGGAAGGNAGSYNGAVGGSGNGGKGGSYDGITFSGYGGTAGGGGRGGLSGVSSYAAAGAGATATASGLTIGGGGGGTGWDATGGAGGNAAGGIYNSGTLTIIGTSAITNNLGAGGGGGGGGGGGNTEGLGGRGVGAIWNTATGNIQITAGNYAAMTGNAAASGSIGAIANGGTLTGSSPAAVAKIHNLGTLNTAYDPTPTLTSATYNAGTGALAVTGANMTTGDTIDVTKLTLTGEGGTTYALTTANVTATNATTFTVTLNGTDQAAVNQLLNKAGATSTGGTTFNLAGAASWDASTTTNADATNTLTVSNVAVPTLTSATYDASTGSLVVTGTGLLSRSGVTNDIVANKFTLTGEGGATYTLTDTANVEITSGTGFTLSLSATDKAAVNQIINKNGSASTGATTFNLAGAEDWNAGADAAVVIADTTGNAVTASNVAVPTLTSATYDASTGTLVVTGTGFLKLNGAANDIDVSKLTLTGEGGATRTLTSSGVEITSGTSFTVSLNAADQAALNQLFNKNGTASTGTTTYNLAGAEDWAAGADPAVVVADPTGNGVTVSNVAVPAITSATYDAATGALVVTGTGFLSLSGATNDIVANKFTITGQGGAGSAYTLTDTANVEITSSTSFTLNLSATDKAAVKALINKDGTAASGGVTYNLAAAEDWNAGADAAVVIVDGTNGITAANASLAMSSATYDASTGILAVTGANMTAGDTIDVTKLTLTGEGGTTYALTTTNVTATSSTAFSVTLNGTDQAALNQLLNKAGTTSTGGATFNLAGAANWDSTASAVADATNALTVSNVAVPTLTSATYDASTGNLVVTGTGLLKLNGAANDIDVSKLTLTGEGGATRTLTSASVEITSGTSFSVSLNAADQAAVNQILNKNGTSSTSATTFNLAGAEDWNAGADAAVVIADTTGNGITASNVAVPTLTSATYDASTGTLVVTGTGFLKLNGAANDIDVSKLTLTGEGGATRTLTSSGVEITSGTSFSVTLNAADQAALNQLFNKNGTSSTGTTTYNLAGAEDWAAGADPAVVVADPTGNGVTVSNVAVPAITSATYDAATGALVVTGTGFLKLNGATNDIVANKFTITGQGGAGSAYTLTDTANVEITSSTSFTLNLSATDKAAIKALINKDGTAASGGITYNLTAAEDWNAGADAAVVIVDGTNGITAANASLAMSSATYDASTGILAVTGANMTTGDTIDVTKLTLTGEGGATYALTTANVTATSSTAFSVTLNGTDQAAVNQLLNKAGATSTGGTTFNLAGAANWDSTASAVADATNALTVSNVAVPTLTSATYDASTGSLVVTGTGLLKLSGATNDIVANKFTLTGEGGATYTLTDTANVDITSGTGFTLSLSATDKAAVNQIINKNGSASTGATTFNLAGAEDWNAGADAAVVIADTTGNAVTASNVAVPTLTSATYDASTGSLVVTGTGFLKLNGATNDIVANKFTLTGEGGATYTLTTTANAEITSGTSFTLSLSAADQAALNQLFNKNGTSSTGTTTYNLAGAEDWAAGADPAVVVADLAGNGITTSNVPTPTITSATYDTGSGLLVVTGTGFLKLSGATNDILVNKFTFTGEGGAGAAYTLTSVSNVEITSGTSFSITLSGTDKTSVDALLNKAGTASTGGTTYNLAAADHWAAGAAAAVNVADLAGNGITVTVPAPASGGGATPPNSDGDNVSNAVENAVPALPPANGGTAVPGDGNGDGVADSQQADVTSLTFLKTTTAATNPGSAPPVYVTLVADSQAGKAPTTGTTSTLNNVQQQDAPANKPADLSMPLGQISFTATVASAGASDSFSLYIDGSVPINGYWKQTTSGSWVNLASAAYGGQVVTEGGKTRLDFKITDGGIFDNDGKADGVITDPGAPGYLAATSSATDSDRDQFPDSLEAANGLTVGVKDNDVFHSSKYFAMQLYRDILFREGETGGLSYWQSQIDSGALNRAQVASAFLASPEFQAGAGGIARLYFGAMHRLPDAAGLAYWMGQEQAGASLSAITSAFATSSEFATAYGSLSNTAFVDQLYLNILNRAVDAAGESYWSGQLAAGVSRATVMSALLESTEGKAALGAKVTIALDYIGLLGRSPEQAGFDNWLQQQQNGTSQVSIIGNFLAAQEYHDRFLP